MVYFILQLTVHRERDSGQELRARTKTQTAEECCLTACSLQLRTTGLGVTHHPEASSEEDLEPPHMGFTICVIKTH